MDDRGSNGALAAARMGLAAGGLLLFAACALLWLVCPVAGARRGIERAGLGILLRAFGVRLALRGKIAPGALYVANHVSWIDIPALALVTGAGFVAKAEIGDWPLIGALARAKGCVFVRREARLGAGAQASDVGARLEVRGIVLFPEGTTCLGEELLPFRSSLFEAVRQAGAAQTQPVALRFMGRDGAALTPAQRRRVAWLDDDALLPHAFALARHGGVTVELCFEPCVNAEGRKAVAAACRAAIAQRLDDLENDQAAMEKRAA